MTVTLYVSQARSLAGATQVVAITKKVKLKAGRGKKLTLKVSSIPSVPAGTYFLLAGITAPDATTTGAAGAGQVTIGPASIRLSPTALKAPASATRGKSATAVLTLADTGNTAASGTVSVNLTGTAAAAGSTAQPVAIVPVNVKLKPNAPKAFKVKFTVPTSLAAGSYTLTATLDVTGLGSSASASVSPPSAGTVVVS